MMSHRWRYKGRGSVLIRFFTSSTVRCAAARVILAIPSLFCFQSSPPLFYHSTRIGMIGLVCTKTPGFLFVKLRRESRTRYEDFCEDEQEKYVAFGQSETQAPGRCLRSTWVCFKQRRVVLPWPPFQRWPCSFGPSPFSLAHTAICVREVKPNLERMFSMCFSIVRELTTRISAISRLALPCAIRPATSRSRSVSPPKARLAARRVSGGATTAPL